MDCRLSTGNVQTFLKMLQEAFAKGDAISLIIEKNGLQRLSGIIKQIDTVSTPIVTLENGASFQIKDIIALNGIFADDYSEC